MRVERNLMRKRISLLFAALMLGLTMSFGGVAFAKIQSGRHGLHDPRRGDAWRTAADV